VKCRERERKKREVCVAVRVVKEMELSVAMHPLPPSLDLEVGVPQ